jgi:geranylgeranyl diphosphate synthase type 3
MAILTIPSYRVDDVEDNSILRRGAPVAHAVYGIPQTINTANYVYFLVFAEVFAMNKGEPMKEVEEMIVEEMVNLHRGQGMDLYWRDNLVCPTESEYIEMVNNKTSGLLRIVIKLMVANSPIVKEGSGIDRDVLIPMVNLIGLLFQIRDDYMNLHSGDYAENKGYCEDLTEGKFSFPIIHSIRTSPSCRDLHQGENGRHRTTGHHDPVMNGDILEIEDREHLLSILQGRPREAKTKRIVVDYMERRTGSFEYSREVMSRLNKLVKAETASLEERLGGGMENKRLRGILGALSKGWIESSPQI